MKNRLIMILVAIQLSCIGVFAQWKPINPDTVSNFKAIVFTSPNKGYLIGCDPVQSSWSSNGLFITNDGGASWVSSLSSEMCPPSVFFIDSNIGYYLTSGSGIGASGIEKTTDGGTTWKHISNTLPGRRIFFTSEQIGYATSDHVEKTTDGGITWTYQNIGGLSTLDAVFFLNNDTGFVGGWYSGVIVKTENGGSTWNLLSTDYGIHCLYFPTAAIGYGVGEDQYNHPVIIKTTDAGATWTIKYTIPQPYPLFFTAIHCPDYNTCYVTGDRGTLLKTTDGGNVWTTVPTGTTHKLNAVCCPDKYNCYAAGDSGIVLKFKDPSTGITSLAPKPQPVAIYPNPMKEQATLTIKGNIPQHTVFRILDITGREIAQYCISTPQTVINKGNIAQGIYFYEVYSPYILLHSGKLVIE